MRIATQFCIGDTAYIKALTPSPWHSWDEVTVSDIHIRVSNMRILYTVRTTEGKETTVDDDHIYKDFSGITVSEKEAELVKVCSRLTELVAELPDNYHPSYPLVKAVLDCINAKSNPPPETESASVEEIVKAHHREYWRKWYAKNKEKRQAWAKAYKEKRKNKAENQKDA